MPQPGQTAAARAYLMAGNTKLAEHYAAEALRQDPDDEAAFDVMGDILLGDKQWQKLEQLAASWLGRNPHSHPAHAFLMRCYCERRDSKMAKALLAHYRSKNPGAAHNIKMLEGFYDIRFGKQGKGFDTLAEAAAAQGDKLKEFRLRSFAAATRRNLSEAIMEGEFARRTGDASAHTLIYLATLYLRTFRLSRCRQRAREAMKADPSRPEPRELVILSYIVWFPPFLLIHAVIWLVTRITGMMKSQALAIVVFLILLMIASPLIGSLAAVMKFLLSPLHLNGLTIFVLQMGWTLYQYNIGGITRLLRGRKSKEVTLADY